MDTTESDFFFLFVIVMGHYGIEQTETGPVSWRYKPRHPRSLNHSLLSQLYNFAKVIR